MDCNHARGLLALHVYGDLEAGEKAQVDTHLAGCPACREEANALGRVRQVLDLPETPKVKVDLARLFEQAGRQQQLRLRRWRRTAAALVAVAAMLLVVFFLKIEIRVQASEFTIRWGTPPAPALPVPAKVVVQAPPAPAISPDEFQVLKNLVHALAENGDVRDRQQQIDVLQLQARIDDLQRQSQARFTAAEHDVAALYANQFGTTDKGTKP